jgi:periplasmic nitrate reductase NapD
MGEEELHIASLVAHAAPSRLVDVRDALNGLTGVCVHASSPGGKIVVTLEHASAEAMTDAVAVIQRLPGVLSAALVYQCADTLEAMNQEMPSAQA